LTTFSIFVFLSDKNNQMNIDQTLSKKFGNGNMIYKKEGLGLRNTKITKRGSAER